MIAIHVMMALRVIIGSIRFRRAIRTLRAIRVIRAIRVMSLESVGQRRASADSTPKAPL